MAAVRKLEDMPPEVLGTIFGYLPKQAILGMYILAPFFLKVNLDC